MKKTIVINQTDNKPKSFETVDGVHFLKASPPPPHEEVVVEEEEEDTDS